MKYYYERKVISQETLSLGPWYLSRPFCYVPEASLCKNPRVIRTSNLGSVGGCWQARLITI